MQNESSLVRDCLNFEFTEEYETTLKAILDSHAPLRRKTVSLRHLSSWYTNEIHQLKLTNRRRRIAKLQVDREIYVKALSAG